MALRSWCLFPASGHTNTIQVSNEGSRRLCAVSRENANGRHASSRSSDTIALENEAAAIKLGEACHYPVTHYARKSLIACMVAGLLTSDCTHLDNFPPPLQHVFGLGAAQASLVQMPPVSLNNRYYLVRAGVSEFESIGVINTNPVTKTNMESGLSEIGRKQTVKAALQLREMGACDGSCWIWPSITQRAYQAAELIAYINNINRSRIVPEYSFLDARGLGAYEGKSLSYVSKVYELDAESPNLRPPPYTDGTPNESVADVLVRVTQLMSILETQYFAENIIIVAPDSDNLSVLQAALMGLDLRRHSSLAFGPGEVRYVDLDSRPVKRITRTSGLLKCENSSQCG